MDIVLTPVEARIVGVLVEKEVTTPEYYPLTLNALTAGCNQKSNRDPVMSLCDEDVSRALGELRLKQLVWLKHTAGSRVPKYAHALSERFEFSPQELACLGVLLLRGPQTPGEIRARTGRMCEFRDLAEVETALGELMDRPNGPIVERLPLQPGRKEARYAHLFCGEVVVPQAGEGDPAAPSFLPGAGDRVSELAEELARVRVELHELKETVARFMSQFE